MNNESKDNFIVMGEASESDDEVPNEISVTSDPKEAIVAGEASESDAEDDYNITSEAFAWRAKNKVPGGHVPKYNSLLHRKLRESNWKLKEHFKGMCFDSIKYVGCCVSDVNQELLSSQILLQESASILRRSVAACSTRLDFGLASLMSNGSNLPSFNFPPPSRELLLASESS